MHIDRLRQHSTRTRDPLTARQSRIKAIIYFAPIPPDKQTHLGDLIGGRTLLVVDMTTTKTAASPSSIRKDIASDPHGPSEGAFTENSDEQRATNKTSFRVRILLRNIYQHKNKNVILLLLIFSRPNTQFAKLLNVTLLKAAGTTTTMTTTLSSRRAHHTQSTQSRISFARDCRSRASVRDGAATKGALFACWWWWGERLPPHVDLLPKLIEMLIWWCGARRAVNGVGRFCCCCCCSAFRIPSRRIPNKGKLHAPLRSVCVCVTYTVAYN